jgi:hypothetical protein
MFKTYYFEDGYACTVMALDRVELAAEVRKHGRLIAVRKA